MQRRQFITLVGGTVIAWPLAARAQQGERMRRIGFLRAAPPSERDLAALLGGLADHGWVQGKNFVLVTQWGDGNVGRLPINHEFELDGELDGKFARLLASQDTVH